MESTITAGIQRIVSGGQTGVDRAALDAALALGLPIGGWCPRGRRAEDGVIDPRYPLTPTPLADYAQRTAWNVRDSDGTLVLHLGDPSPGTHLRGTHLTIEKARVLGKALLRINLARNPQTLDVVVWVAEKRIRVLNVAGPRESETPGVYKAARVFLEEVFRRLR